MKKKVACLLIAALVAMVNLKAQVIVLSESFENGIPAGWTQENVVGDQAWVAEKAPKDALSHPDGAVSGFGRAALRNTTGESKGYKTRLISPVMNLDTVFQPILRYYHAQAKWTADFDTLRVYYRNTTEGRWVLLQEFARPIQTWTKEMVELPRVSKTYQICFEGSENLGRGIVLDSVIVRSKPECTTPHDMTVTNMHKGRVTLNWLASFDAVDFQIVLAKADTEFDIDTLDLAAAERSGLILKDTTVMGLQNYVNLTGIEGKTNYVAYVRSLCETENSDWGTLNFYMKAIETLPYSNDFNVSKSSTVAQHRDWTYGTDLDITTPFINCNLADNKQSIYSHSGYSLSFAGKTALGSSADIPANKYAYAATPMLDVEDLSQYQVRFWGSLGDYGSYKTKARAIIVGVMDDPEDISTFVAVDTIRLWKYATSEHCIVSLASYKGEGRYVTFMSRFDVANQFFIDDITIEAIPAVGNITDITVEPLTEGVSLTWKNVAASYNVLIATKAVDDVTTLQASERISESKTSTPSVMATGLTPNTRYYAYIQADGGAWSAPVTFKTSAKVALSLMKFGFEDTYAEGSVKYPTNIGVYSTAPSRPSINTSTTYAHSGTGNLKYSLAFGGSTGGLEIGRDAWAVLPMLDTVVQGVEMEFWMRAYSTTYKSTQVTIGVMTNPEDLTTFVEVASMTNATATYQRFYTDFLSYTGNGKYIAIRWTEKAGETSKSHPVLDDVLVTELSKCIVPAVSITDITSETATICWKADNMTNFQVLVDSVNTKSDAELTAAFNKPSKGIAYTGTIANANQVTIPVKLHWGHTYYAYVRSDCGDGEVSWWSRPSAFTLTIPEAIPLPYKEDFDLWGTGSDAMAAGWMKVSFSQYPMLNSNSKHTGVAGVGFKSDLPARAGKLVAPILDIEDYNKLKITFWGKKDGSYASADSLRIGVANGADTTQVVTWLDTITIPKTDRWDMYTATLSGWQPAMGKHLVFQLFWMNTSRGVFIDEIKFETQIGIVPFGIEVTDKSANDATITWKGFSDEGWNLVLTTESVNPDSLHKVAANSIVIKDSIVTSAPITFKGLRTQQGYYMYLRPVGGKTWSDEFYFMTECVERQLPIREGFEGLTTPGTQSGATLAVFPDCWTRHSGDELKDKPNDYPVIYTVKKTETNFPNDYSHSGKSSVFMKMNSTSGGPAYFVTPKLKVNNMGNVSVGLWARCNDGGLGDLYIGVMKNPDDWSSFTKLYTYTPTDKQWSYIECRFGDCGDYKEGLGDYIAISTPAVFSKISSYYMDDIEIVESACRKATPIVSDVAHNSVILAYSNTEMDMRMILMDSVTISVDSLNMEDNAAYLAKLTKSDKLVYDTIIKNQVGLPIEGLESDNNYYVALQTQCEDGNALWVTTSFKTLCQPQDANNLGVITFEEKEFNAITNSASSDIHSVPCWIVGKKGIPNNMYIPYVGTGGIAPAGSNFLYFRSTATNEGNGGYAIMPAVDVDSIARMQVSFLGRALQTANAGQAFKKPTGVSPITTCAGSIIVGIISDPSDISTFAPVDTISYADDAVHKTTVRFNEYKGKNNRYGKHVMFLSEFGANNFFFIDNIRVDSLTDCEKPARLEVQDITDESAKASWNGLNASYRVMVTESAIPETVWENYREYVSNDTVTMPTITLHGLQGAKTYYVYVKAICDNGDGEWCAESLSFVTDCPVAVSLPYEENFDRYPAVAASYPACWRRFYANKVDDKANRPVISTSAKYGTSGNGVSWLHTNNTLKTRPYLATMPISGDIGKTTVSFKIASDGKSRPQPSGIALGIARDVSCIDSLLATVHYVDTVLAPANSTEWKEYSRIMDDCSGENMHIVLAYHYVTSTGNNFYFDDFKVEKTPTCYAPDEVTIDNITTESIRLTILPHFPTDNAWQARAISIDGKDTVWASSTATTLVVQGLKPATKYNVYVRTDCGAGDVSAWSVQPVSVRTLYEIGAGMFYGFEEDEEREVRIAYSYNTGTSGTGTGYTIHPSLYASGRLGNSWPSQLSNRTLARTGSGVMRLYHSMADAAPTYFALPKIAGSDTLQIRFDMRALTESIVTDTLKNADGNPIEPYVVDTLKELINRTYPFAKLELGLINTNYDMTSYQPLATYQPTMYDVGDSVITEAKNRMFDQIVFPLPVNMRDKYLVFMAPQAINIALHIDNIHVEKKQGFQTPVIGKSTITPTSLTFDWEPNTATKWNVYLTTNVNAFPLDSAAKADIVENKVVTVNTVTFTGLKPNTKYFAYVQVADAKGLGATSARRTFVTPVDTPIASDSIITFEVDTTVVIKNGIKKDTIQVYKVVPTNWYAGNDASSIALAQPGARLNGYETTSEKEVPGVRVSYRGERALQLYSTYSGTLGAYAVMPMLNADFDTIQVNFYARPFFESKNALVGITRTLNLPLVVGTMTDPNNPATFVPVDSFLYSNRSVQTTDAVKNLPNNGWEQFSFRLNGRSGQYIAFSAPQAGSQWYIDNISFGAYTCMKPHTLQATNITGHTAVLSWKVTDNSNPSILQVATTSAFSASDMVLVDTLTATQREVSGLQGTTQYYYRVRQICGDTEDWALLQTFTTDCAEIGNGYTNNFEDTEEHVFLPGTTAADKMQPRCWTVGSTICPSGSRSLYNYTPRLQGSTATECYSRNTETTELRDKYSLRFEGNGYKGEIPSNLCLNYYDMWIAMPMLDSTVNVDALQLSFYGLPGRYNPTTGTVTTLGTMKTIVVGVMSDPTDISTFVDLDTCVYTRDLKGAVASASNDYMFQRFEVPLAGMKGKGSYIAFRTNAQDWMDAHPEYTSQSIRTQMYIDDIAIEELSNCAMPINLKATEIALTSAKLAWQGEEGAQFVLNISTEQTFSDPASFLVKDTVLSDMAFIINELDTFTTYYWSVYQQCGPTSQSMAAAEQFSTLRTPVFNEMFTEPVAIPADWSLDATRAKDVFAGTPMTGSSAYSWSRDANENNIGMECPHMRAGLNSNSSSDVAVLRRSWLITPIVVLDDTKDAWLTFNAALTYSNKADAPDLTGWDDQFMVVVSEDAGNTWHRENATIWNNETTNDPTDEHYIYGKGDYVLNNLPVKADKTNPIYVDLSKYHGKSIKVGFYYESSAINADNSLRVGDVHINYFTKRENAPQTACQFEDVESPLFYIDGDNVSAGEHVFTKAMIVPDGSTSQDTLYTFRVTYNEAPQTVINKTICEGEETGAEWGFANRSVSGTYKRKLQSAVTGCDSITTLNLTVIPRQYSTIEDTICSGTSYTFNGVEYSKTCVHIDTLTSVITGCDSITKLILTVNPPITSTVEAHSCTGAPYYFTERYPALTLSGTYMDTIHTAEGCDSVVTLNLVVSDVINIAVYDTICQGESSTFEGKEYSETGTYPVQFQSVAGCDSIRTLYLTVAPLYKDTIHASICQGGIYNENGFSATEAGQYTLTKTSIFGCDSVTILDLVVTDLDTIRVDTLIQVADLPYFYPNTQITYPLSTEPGVYTDTISVKGKDHQCDYILIHRLTIEGGDGVDNNRFGSITLQPNVISVGETVVATGDFAGQTVTVDVYDMVGHCVSHGQISSQSVRIDAFHVAGLYTVRITDGQGNPFIGRVIVK